MGDYVVLEMLDPRGEAVAAGKTPLAPRLSLFEGKKIGLVWNGKASADILLGFVGDLLRERYPSVRTKLYTTSNVANRLKPGELEGIAREVDAVIYASGD